MQSMREEKSSLLAKFIVLGKETAGSEADIKADVCLPSRTKNTNYTLDAPESSTSNYET